MQHNMTYQEKGVDLARAVDMTQNHEVCPIHMMISLEIPSVMSISPSFHVKVQEIVYESAVNVTEHDSTMIRRTI